MSHLQNDRGEIFMNLYYPELISGLDVEKWVDYYAKAGATSFCVDIKDQAFVYYDSKFAPKWGILGTRDLADELSRAVRKRGLKWSAYISPGEFEWLNSDHSRDSWQIRFEDGTGNTPDRDWIRKRYCFNSPYFDLFLNVIREIAEKYHPDGFFLDGLLIPWSYERGLCYCENCRNRFRREYGIEMPGTAMASSEEYTLFIDSRRKWNADFSRKLRAVVDSVDPEIALVGNCVFGFHSWTCSTQPETADSFDFMCAEDYPAILRSEKHPAEFSQCDTFCWKASLLRMLSGGRQGEFYSHFTRDLPLEEMLLNLDLYSGAGMRSTISFIGKNPELLFRRLEEAKPYNVNLLPAPRAVLHFSENTHIGGFRSQAAMPRMLEITDDPFFQEPMLFFKTALETHYPLECVSDTDLNRGNLLGAQTLILPDSMVKPEGFDLRSSVENGLNLLATMECSTRTFAGRSTGGELLFRGSGIHSSGLISTEHPWRMRWENGNLAFQNPLPADPPVFLSFPEGDAEKWTGSVPWKLFADWPVPLLQGASGCLADDPQSVHFPFEALKVEASAEWRVLARFKYTERGSSVREESPAILERGFGKGKILYFAFRMTTGLRADSVMIRSIFEEAMRRLDASAEIRIEAPPCVKTWFYRRDGEKIVHFVNTLAPEADGMYANSRIPVPVGIVLPGISRERVSVPLGGENAEISGGPDNGCSVFLPSFRDRMVLRISEKR